MFEASALVEHKFVGEDGCHEACTLEHIPKDSPNYGVYNVGLPNRFMSCFTTAEGELRMHYHASLHEASHYANIKCSENYPTRKLKGFGAFLRSSKSNVVAWWLTPSGRKSSEGGFTSMAEGKKYGQKKHEEQLEVVSATVMDPSTRLVPYGARKSTDGMAPYGMRSVLRSISKADATFCFS